MRCGIPLILSPLILGLGALVAGGCTVDGRRARDTLQASADAQQLTHLAAAPQVRRVRVHPDNMIDSWGSRPSPDGRYLPATNWATGDLVLIDFQQDTIISVTGKTSWADEGYAYGAAFTNDGRSVIYTWFLANDRVQLRLMPIAGPDSGNARVILDLPETVFVMPQSATPDDRHIICYLQRRGSENPEDRLYEMVSVSLADGDMRVIKGFDWRWPQNIAVSPDGRWIAYDFQPDEMRPERDVHAISIDGTREWPLLKEAIHEFVVGWTSSGTHLLYGTDHSAVATIWALPIADGRASGPAVMVRSDIWRMWPVGTARNGTFVYVVETGRRDVYTAMLNSRDGTVASQPVSATGSAPEALPWSIAFSPDAQHVAYLAYRGGGQSGPSDILIRRLDGGVVRRLRPRTSMTNNIRWLSDGNTLMIGGLDEKGKQVIARVDIASDRTEIVAELLRPTRAVTVSADGRYLYYATPDTGHRSNAHIDSRQPSTTQLLIQRDLRNGDRRTLYKFDNPGVPTTLALSRDEKHLALFTRFGSDSGAVMLLATDGSSVRLLYTLPRGRTISPMAGSDWSPDGRYVYFGASSESDADLWRVSVEDGSGMPIGISGGALTRLRISPDGTRIGWGVAVFASEIWVMDPPQLPDAPRRVGSAR